MAMPQDKLSSEPVPETYLDPDGRARTLNEDWESGPIAITDTTQGLFYQAWKLTFSAGDFILTPETTGGPVVALQGVDSVQCTLAFDQNANYTIAWEDSVNQGHLYWFNSEQGQYETTDFANEIWGLMLCLDDKRSKQNAANDILLFYTLQSPSGYALWHRRQRDRFENAILLRDPAWPYLHKLGMHEGLRVQITNNTVPPI